MHRTVLSWLIDFHFVIDIYMYKYIGAEIWDFLEARRVILSIVRTNSSLTQFHFNQCVM